MAAVSETIVREYFELHEFLVRQFRKHLAPAGREEDDVDFLVLNPQPKTVVATPLPFELRSEDMPRIDRALVVVKAWHTEVFTPAFLTNTPRLFQFLNKKPFQQARRAFGRETPPLVIVAIPCLPRAAHARDESFSIMRAKGIDAVLCFTTMLADLIAKVEPRRNYQKSDLLQLVRILKQYDFFKDPQMELFKRTKS